MHDKYRGTHAMSGAPSKTAEPWNATVASRVTRIVSGTNWYLADERVSFSWPWRWTSKRRIATERTDGIVDPSKVAIGALSASEDGFGAEIADIVVPDVVHDGAEPLWCGPPRCRPGPLDLLRPHSFAASSVVPDPASLPTAPCPVAEPDLNDGDEGRLEGEGLARRVDPGCEDLSGSGHGAAPGTRTSGGGCDGCDEGKGDGGELQGQSGDVVLYIERVVAAFGRRRESRRRRSRRLCDRIDRSRRFDRSRSQISHPL